jgi:hypothetical protein
MVEKDVRSLGSLIFSQCISQKASFVRTPVPSWAKARSTRTST